MKSLALVLLCVLIACVVCERPRRKQLSTNDADVVKATNFALEEIRKLTDSYRDMRVNSILSAESARSAFADGTNYFLKLELQCTSVCAAPLSPASTCRRGNYKGVNEVIVFWKDDDHYDGIAIDEFPQMDGEYHPCTPSYKGTEKCNPAEHRTPEQAALFADEPRSEL